MAARHGARQLGRSGQNGISLMREIAQGATHLLLDEELDKAVAITEAAQKTSETLAL